MVRRGLEDQGTTGGAAMMLIDDPFGCAVFLDLDGTLIDIAVAPDLVHIPSDLVPLLARLSSGLRGACFLQTNKDVTAHPQSRELRLELP
jgi:trehalose 6-phosphate phosphatase